MQEVIDVLPISIACARVNDARVVLANSRFLRTFQLSADDIGRITAYELVAPEHEEIFRRDHDGDHGRGVGDEAEQFRVFRRKDGSTFVGWSRNVMIDLPDGARAAMSVIFEYYDEDADRSNTAAYYGFQASTARYQLAKYISQELNSSLHQIGLALNDELMPDAVRVRVRKALARTDLLGERLVQVGLLEKETHEAVLEAQQRVATRSSVPHHGGDLQPLRVLIVDDDEDLSMLLADLLRRDGHTVDVTHRLADARESLAVKSPDLLLLDLVLGDEDGRVLAREIEAKGIGVRVVFMTAFAHAAAIAEATSRFPLLRKPFEAADLRNMITRVMAQ